MKALLELVAVGLSMVFENAEDMDVSVNASVRDDNRFILRVTVSLQLPSLLADRVDIPEGGILDD